MKGLINFSTSIFLTQAIFVQHGLSFIIPHAARIHSTSTLGRSSGAKSLGSRYFLASRQSPIVIPTQYSVQPLFSQTSDDDDSTNKSKPMTIRDQLRKLTGFSLTAFRATMRATTGFSLTALRATLRAATGVSLSSILKRILGIFPSWARYFIQPFLILYYAPLLILRSLVGSTKDSHAEARRAHERVVEEWKRAVQVAENVTGQGYWPVHVNERGFIVAVPPPDPETIRFGEKITDVTDAVAESVEVAARVDSNSTFPRKEYVENSSYT